MRGRQRCWCTCFTKSLVFIRLRQETVDLAITHDTIAYTKAIATVKFWALRSSRVGRRYSCGRECCRLASGWVVCWGSCCWQRGWARCWRYRRRICGAFCGCTSRQWSRCASRTQGSCFICLRKETVDLTVAHNAPTHTLPSPTIEFTGTRRWGNSGRCCT